MHHAQAEEQYDLAVKASSLQARLMTQLTDSGTKSESHLLAPMAVRINVRTMQQPGSPLPGATASMVLGEVVLHCQPADIANLGALIQEHSHISYSQQSEPAIFQVSSGSYICFCCCKYFHSLAICKSDIAF